MKAQPKPKEHEQDSERFEDFVAAVLAVHKTELEEGERKRPKRTGDRRQGAAG